MSISFRFPDSVELHQATASFRQCELDAEALVEDARMEGAQASLPLTALDEAEIHGFAMTAPAEVASNVWLSALWALMLLKQRHPVAMIAGSALVCLGLGRLAAMAVGLA